MGIGDPEIWEVRIHFDGLDNVERKLGRDDITYMNILALIETQGYGIRDSVYCRKGEGMDLVENNAKIYELLEHFNATKALNLTVKRGRAAVPEKINKPVHLPAAGRAIVRYADQVVYDLSPAPVYVVDDDGAVIPSQVSSVGSQSQYQGNNPYVATQESINVAVDKGKSIEIEEDVGSEEEDGYFSMGEEDFAAMEKYPSSSSDPTSSSISVDFPLSTATLMLSWVAT